MTTATPALAAIAATISSPARHRAPPARARRAPRPGRRPGWRTPRRDKAPPARARRALRTGRRPGCRTPRVGSAPQLLEARGPRRARWVTRGSPRTEVNRFATSHHFARHPAVVPPSMSAPARHSTHLRRHRLAHGALPDLGGVPAGEHHGGARRHGRAPSAVSVLRPGQSPGCTTPLVGRAPRLRKARGLRKARRRRLAPCAFPVQGGVPAEEHQKEGGPHRLAHGAFPDQGGVPAEEH